MFALFWNLSAALNGYMRFYMPTNRAVEYLRSPRGLKWAIPVALVATPAYLFAMSVCATIMERGGPGYLNVLVMIFAWNAIKFAVTGVVSLPMMVCKGITSAQASDPGYGAPTSPTLMHTPQRSGSGKGGLRQPAARRRSHIGRSELRSGPGVC